MDRKDLTQIKKVLTIDGGGIKGIMPATYLANIEETLNINVAEYFDLIVGTSTGGIIALGLGLGLSANQILNFYREKGPKVFNQDIPSSFAYVNRLFLKGKGIFIRKYDSTNLKNELTSIFGELKLGHSKNRLVIPAYSDTLPGPYLLKTAHHERFKNDYKQYAVDVAMATSAAPTYFSKYQIQTGEVLIDGGVWANNPIGVAALEAACVLEWDMKNVHILSLGCTSSIKTYPKHGGKFSLAGEKIVNLLLDGQSHAATATAKLLLGGPEAEGSIIREEVSLKKDYFETDDTSKIDTLEGLSLERARHSIPKIQNTFFSSKAKPFIPIHKENANA